MKKATLRVCVHGHLLADLDIDLDSLKPTVREILTNPAVTEPEGPEFAVYFVLPEQGQILIGVPAGCARSAFKEGQEG